MANGPPDLTKRASEFKQLASEKQSGVLAEMVAFLRQNKKWWLLPIVAVLLLVGLFLVLGSTGAAPFIYTLF